MGKMLAQHPAPDGMGGRDEPASPTQAARKRAVDANDPATWTNTPRNASCPCGSGKKYKHCHGRS
jgi:preprotein translocase subunit SecA